MPPPTHPLREQPHRLQHTSRQCWVSKRGKGRQPSQKRPGEPRGNNPYCWVSGTQARQGGGKPEPCGARRATCLGTCRPHLSATTGPSQGARWSPHCQPQRGPQTTENQHFIELTPQKSTPADFLFAVGITVTDGGVTSTPSATHDMADPREEGSFWGQATAEWAGAGRAVNQKDPRGIIHLSYQKKRKKEKNKYETSGVSQHSEFKYKKWGHKKTVKKTTKPTRPPPGWRSRGRGPAPPPHWPAARHWRRWRLQSRSSSSSSSKDSLRPRVGDTCRMEVGRRENHQPGRGALTLQLASHARSAGRTGVVKRKLGKVGTREHLAQNRRRLGQGDRKDEGRRGRKGTWP